MNLPRVLPALLLLLGSLTACGNWIQTPVLVGTVGVGVDRHGDPVVVLASCSDGRVTVILTAWRSPTLADDEPNRRLGRWKQDVGGAPTRLVLARPGAGWSPATPVGDADLRGAAIVDAVPDDAAHLEAMSGVTYSAVELAALRPGQLLTADGTISAGSLRAHCD